MPLHRYIAFQGSMAFLPRFFNGGTHTITSTLAQYDPTTPLQLSNPDIIISLLSWGGWGSGSASVAYGSPPHGGNRYGSNGSSSALQWCSVFIFAIFSGMQSEKSDGQRRERRVLFTATRPSPLHLHYGFMYSAHFVGSTLPLLFGVGAGDRQNLRRAAE